MIRKERGQKSRPKEILHGVQNLKKPFSLGFRSNPDPSQRRDKSRRSKIRRDEKRREGGRSLRRGEETEDNKEEEVEDEMRKKEKMEDKKRRLKYGSHTD